MPLVPEEDVKFQKGTLLRVLAGHRLRVHPAEQQTTFYQLREGDICVVLYTRLGKKMTAKPRPRHHWTVMLTKHGMMECSEKVAFGFYEHVEIV